MSKATKRKHVTREVVEELRLPSEDEQIVKVTAGRGNNLHEVVDQHGQVFLVSMPTKFRKNVWIKRGDYILVSLISEGDKVKGEITSILYKEQIKYIRNQGAWPTGFDIVPPSEELSKLKVGSVEEDSTEEEGSHEDSDDDIFQNTNRPVYDASSEDSDTDEEE